MLLGYGWWGVLTGQVWDVEEEEVVPFGQGTTSVMFPSTLYQLLTLDRLYHAVSIIWHLPFINRFILRSLH